MKNGTGPEGRGGGVERDALQELLDETRRRFVATFAAQCDALSVLVDEVAASPVDTLEPAAALTQVAHRLSGLAGTVGFPTVTARAAELEDLVSGAGGAAVDAARARQLVQALRDAFTSDVASPPPVWAPAATATAHGAKILVAEDESDQRAIVTACLEGAGYTPLAVVSGDLVVGVARAEKPALILLDIDLPQLDGYAVCRLLKADPELAGIPVIFMTTRANVDDRLAGLTLGADEFLSKPVDMRELALRIQLLLKRSQSHQSPGAGQSSASGEPTRDRAGRPAAGPAARTVVIAEDDPDVTRIVDAQLRAAGCRTILAVDGEQALAAVHAHAPDMLVLDLMMPKRNGFEVLAAVRRGPAPQPRVIVLTSRGREQDVLRAFELGADDYMTKPFNPQELMARTARLLP